MTSEDQPRNYHLVAEDGVPSAAELQREWDAARKRKLEQTPASSTIAAAWFLIRLGDAKRFERWLNSHSGTERAAIAKHLLEHKR
jgi:hypothetical protein